MGIDRIAQVRDHALADPTDKIEARGTGDTQHGGDRDESQKIRVEEGRIGGVKAIVEKAATGDGHDER